MSPQDEEAFKLNQYAKLYRKFRHDIPFFAEHMFGSNLRPKQVEFVTAFQNNKRITMRGGIGYGKTHAAAVLVLWGILFFNDIKITCVGPTEAQITTGLWSEITTLHAKMPPEWRDFISVNTTKVERIGVPTAFATKAVANSQNTTALRGIHAPNNWVIADEASGLEDEVLDVLSNVLSDGPGARFCLISNPTKTSGFFYRTHTDPDPDGLWTRLHGSIRDNPNVTEPEIQAMIRQYGGPLSALAKINVDGDFPMAGGDGVIPMEAVNEAALATGIIPSYGSPIIWGVDVASGGGGKTDRTVLIKRQDNTVSRPTEWFGYDTVQVVEAIRQEYENTAPHLRPKAIAVDAIGIGQGVYDGLKYALPDNVARSIKVSNKPIKSPERHNRLRDELWWSVREWLLDGGVSLPNHKDLLEELALPGFNVDNGKVKVDDKRQLRKKSGKSPDYADALCLTFAVNAAALGSGKYAWGRPIKYRPTASY